MDKKVLLAGSSYSAIPIYASLARQGFKVIPCGGIASDPCHAICPESLHFNYANRELLLEHFDEGDFDFLCPSCNDYAYLASAWVAEQRDLPGYDSFEITQIMHNKDQFRAFCSKHGFPVPKAQSFTIQEGRETDFSSWQTFPALVKPIDSFSGRGMTKVFSSQQILDAVSNAKTVTRSKEIVIEAFLEGSLHSHSIFFADGECIFDIFADEYCSTYPYQVNCSNAPSCLPNKLQDAFRECIRALIQAAGLTDGLLHTQFLVNGSQFSLIECMRRAPGDLYYKMIEMATGVNGFELYAAPFTRQKLVAAPNATYTPSGRHTISIDRHAVLDSFSFDCPGDDLEIVPLKYSGEKLGPAPFDKLGIVFFKYKSSEDMKSLTPRLAEYTRIVSVTELEHEKD